MLVATLGALPTFTTSRCTVVDQNGICVQSQNTYTPQMQPKGGAGRTASALWSKFVQLSPTSKPPPGPFGPLSPTATGNMPTGGGAPPTTPTSDPALPIPPVSVDPAPSQQPPP